jgi:hypothetical protein
MAGVELLDNKSGKDLEPCSQCNDYYYKMPTMEVCSKCKLRNQIYEF